MLVSVRSELRLEEVRKFVRRTLRDCRADFFGRGKTRVMKVIMSLAKFIISRALNPKLGSAPIPTLQRQLY